MFNDFENNSSSDSSSSSGSSDSLNSSDSNSSFLNSSLLSSSSSLSSSLPNSSSVCVISVGGSLFAGSPINHLFIREFSNLINSLFSEGYRFCIVVGGGKIARSYISVAKSLGANNFELDELGISITRANASLFIPAIFSAHVEVLSSIKSASNVLALNQTPIFGGTHPGFSSDAVAALIAEFVGGNFYNLSNVDGIFSSDPKKSSSPKLFSELSHNQLVELCASSASSPGQNFVIDLVASKILARSNIKSFFLNGLDLENFKNCILGNDFKGTVVSSPNK